MEAIIFRLEDLKMNWKYKLFHKRKSYKESTIKWLIKTWLDIDFLYTCECDFDEIVDELESKRPLELYQLVTFTLIQKLKKAREKKILKYRLAQLRICNWINPLRPNMLPFDASDLLLNDLHGNKNLSGDDISDFFEEREI